MDYDNSIFCMEDESNDCLPEVSEVAPEPEIVSDPPVDRALNLKLKSQELVAKFFKTSPGDQL